MYKAGNYTYGLFYWLGYDVLVPIKRGYPERGDRILDLRSRVICFGVGFLKFIGIFAYGPKYPT